MKRYPNRTHYTRHFTRAELDCKCDRHGDGPRKHSRKVRRRLRRLARQLEKLRRAHGEPIVIASGYRCEPHNREVGGAIKSQHVQARAADIAVPGKTKKQKLDYQSKLVDSAMRVRAFRLGGIGVYPSGDLHVDVRGWVARWSSYVGWR